MSKHDEVKVTHDEAAGRFEATVDGQRCELEYTLRDGVAVLTHTGVPAALEGRGIAAQLVAAALAHARQAGWQVRPACSYAAAYMQRHPETQDLMA